MGRLWTEAKAKNFDQSSLLRQVFFFLVNTGPVNNIPTKYRPLQTVHIIS